MKAAVLVFPLALATAACSGDAAPDAYAGAQVDTLPDGVVHVRNPPIDADASPRWRIEPEVVIGAADGEGPEVFGQIRGVAPLPDGRIAVLDAQAQEVRIFAADGAHDRTFGGQGQGPGEFAGANGMVLGHDGVLRVHDPRNSRLSFLHPDSGYLRSTPVQIMSWGFLWGAVVDEQDRVYEESMVGTLSEQWWSIKVYDAQGAWVDTVQIYKYDPDSTDGEDGLYRYDRGASAVPFWPRGVYALDAAGYYWRKPPDVNAYRIVQSTFEGDTLRIFEAERPVQPVPPDSVDAAIEVLRERAGRELDWSRIPSDMPLVETIFRDDRGRVWVRVNTADPELTTFDVFSAEGVYQGSAVTALRIPTYWKPAIVGDQFYTMQTDDLDVPYVVRARIREVGG